MDFPGPPPEGPEMFPGGPPPGGPAPLPPEVMTLLIILLCVVTVACVVVIFFLLKKKTKASAATVPFEAPSALYFKSDYKTISVSVDDIRYVESMSEYVKIYLDSQPDPLVILYSLKRLERELPVGRFMRIHRSYLIALDRIREANASSVVLEGDVNLPVSDSYRPAFKEYLRTVR